MALNISVPANNVVKTQPRSELLPRITVIGIGGAGGNAVNNMIAAGLEGVEFIAANTDAQNLAQSHAANRIQLGTSITKGLGAGSSPEVGAQAAEESLEDVREALEGAHMVFITAGMGGGTGTGSAPIIAQAAKEMDALVVGVVTKPFQFEGSRRLRLAEEGIRKLEPHVDTLIVIPNQNLFRIVQKDTTFADAFRKADEVLQSGVKSVTDLMTMPGLINLDFADIRATMRDKGKAMMGTGEADGENRSISAAEAAISNPLLDEASMRGAQSVLINISGGKDITLYEVDEAITRIREELDSDANLIFGSTFDETLEGRIRVSVVATGLDPEAIARPDETEPEQPVPAPQYQSGTGQGDAAKGSEDPAHAGFSFFHAKPREAANAPREDTPSTGSAEPADQEAGEDEVARIFAEAEDRPEPQVKPETEDHRMYGLDEEPVNDGKPLVAEPAFRPAGGSAKSDESEKEKGKSGPGLLKRMIDRATGHKPDSESEPAPKPAEEPAAGPATPDTEPAPSQPASHESTEPPKSEDLTVDTATAEAVRVLTQSKLSQKAAPAPAYQPKEEPASSKDEGESFINLGEEREARSAPKAEEPRERAKTEEGPVQEDLLDIPAFLRRKA